MFGGFGRSAKAWKSISFDFGACLFFTASAGAGRASVPPVPVPFFRKSLGSSRRVRREFPKASAFTRLLGKLSWPPARTVIASKFVLSKQLPVSAKCTCRCLTLRSFLSMVAGILSICCRPGHLRC